MSALKLNQRPRYKEILIKNIYKPPSDEYVPNYGSSSSNYLKNKVKSIPKVIKPSVSGNLRIKEKKNNTSFSNNDIKYNTFRLSSNKGEPQKFFSEKKDKKRQFMSNSFKAKKVENDFLPPVIQNKNKSSIIMESKIQPYKSGRNSFDAKTQYFKVHNTTRVTSILNNSDNSNKILSILHNKSQSVSFEKADHLNYSKKAQVVYKVNNQVSNLRSNPLYQTILSKYSCRTKPGIGINGCTKTNQDSYSAKNKIFGFQNFSFFGVFDGHGVNGHLVSRFLKDYLGQYFTKKENYLSRDMSDAELNEKKCYEKISNGYFMKHLFSNVDDRIKKQKFDTVFSGSTGVLIFHIEDKLICYNVGDSRAVYINDKGVLTHISRDHKPNIHEEEARIINAGGRVDRIQNFQCIGPYRVWLKNQDYPGLAMSRSFGDFMAKSVGVICEPEYFELGIIEKNIKAVILASDGLWEFLSDQKILEIITPFLKANDCAGANKKLVEEAFKAWRNDGVICDDITIIVLFFRKKQA